VPLTKLITVVTAVDVCVVVELTLLGDVDEELVILELPLLGLEVAGGELFMLDDVGAFVAVPEADAVEDPLLDEDDVGDIVSDGLADIILERILDIHPVPERDCEEVELPVWLVEGGAD
jgi:hypothetical protein